MERALIGAAAAALCVTLGTGAARAEETVPPPPTTAPPLSSPPSISATSGVLSNGLKYYLLEDHEVGLIEGKVMLKGGTRGEDTTGLSDIAVGVQRTGGTRAHPSGALDAALDALGAQVETGSAMNTLSLGFSGLAEDAEEVLNLATEVLTEPLFEEQRLEVARAQVLNAIEHRFDAPGALPGRLIVKLIYGAESPLAREPTAEAIGALTSDDLRAYWARWERPDNAVIGVVGDFDTREMKSTLERTIGRWKPAEGEPEKPPTLAPLPSPPKLDGSIRFIRDQGTTQATVVLGELGTTVMEEDTVALSALNSVLNGFGGRLFNEVRSKGGLAYSVSGSWAPGVEYPGTFVATGETDRPGRFLKEVKRVLAEVGESRPPSAEELSAAKQSSLNAFVFTQSRPSKTLFRLVSYDVAGIPADFLEQYYAKLRDVDVKDVTAAAQRRLHPATMDVVVVGNDRLRGELGRELGEEAQIIDLEIADLDNAR